MNLQEIRQQIDSVDADIKGLFAERMALAERVAQIKAESNDVIYKPERETQIIDRLTSDVPPEIREEYTVFVKKVLSLSRKYQYRRMLEINNFSLAESNSEKAVQFKNFTVQEENNGVKLVFSCSGSDLAGVITIIADYGIKITEINYRPSSAVYIRLDASMHDDNVQALMRQLAEETKPV